MSFKGDLRRNGIDPNDRLVMVHGLPVSVTTPVTESTAGNVTLTSANIFNTIIRRTTGGVARSDTLPTATLLNKYLNTSNRPIAVGDGFEFKIKNLDAGDITLLAGTGVTLVDVTVVAANATSIFRVYFTAVCSSPAYTVEQVLTV